MPLTNASEISVVLSGGSINIDPNLSLGGDPSTTPITDNVLNNLFSDVTATQTEDGLEDYRCIYFFNDGDTTVFVIELWIEEDFNDDAGSVEIGTESRDEVQRIVITGNPNGGSFTLSYEGHEFTSSYNADLSVWASNLQEQIADLENDDNELFFNDVEVAAATSESGSIVFDIKFSGDDAKRSFSEFVIEENNLTSLTSTAIVHTVPQRGAPVNTIASEINLSTTPPGNVSFAAASEVSPITIPFLKSGEGFPLWIKRSTPAGTTAQAANGFKLTFKAESLSS